MTRISMKMIARFGTAAALSLFLAAPSLATDVTLQFNLANFPDAANLTNPRLSYGNGDSFSYKAETPDGCEWSVVHVAGLEPIDVDPGPGVTMLSVREVEDFEYEDEACDGPDAAELSEKTFDWYGQDNAGNVWYFGEDTTEYLFDDDGNPIGSTKEGSWEAGVDGAVAGLIMLAEPGNGDFYQQEFYADVAEDRGKVLRTNARVSIGIGDFDDCLVTKEWSPLSPGSIEHKSYCPEAGGLVLIEHAGGQAVAEAIDLGL